MSNLISLLRNKEKIAFFSFLLLTIFFIIYQLIISFGVIPDFIGGWYAKFSIIILFLILCNIDDFLKDLLRTKFSTIYILYYIYILIYLFIISISDRSLILPFLHALTSLIHGFVLFFIGYYLNFNSRILLKILYLCLVVSFISLFLYFVFTGNLMFNASMLLDEEDITVSSYQVFGRSAFLCLSVLILRYTSFYKSILVSLLGVFVLFFLGSRTETIGFIFVSLFFLIYQSGFNPLRHITVSIFFVILTYCIYSQLDKILTTRFGQLFDLNSSTSWSDRKEYLIYAQNTVSNHFILGDFGASYKNFGEVGANAHNIIAAWSNFGILGYLLFILCCITPIILSLVGLLHKNKSNGLIFCLFFGLACTILLFTSKSIFWIIPPFFWGVFLGTIRKGYFTK